jgi:hypothetical protein
MAFRKVVSPSGKTFHWKCESLNCPYESEETKVRKLTISKRTANAPPTRCPKCGCK